MGRAAVVFGGAVLAMAVAGILLLPVIVFAAILGSPAPGDLTVIPAGADIPPDALAAYQLGAQACPGLSWTVLAAIGKVESDHGRSDLPGVRAGANPAGAEGPMQMLAATFREYAAPGGSPYAIADAALAAARMLCADGGATPAGLRAAIWAYNHSEAYVDDVLGWAERYGAPGAVAVTWALAQVGKPYLWGAAGPDAFDCSGLVLRAWQAAGVTLPRVAADQYRAGAHVPVAAAQAGDLVFFGFDPADPATIDHVGIALGDGRMVEAPHTGALVRVVPIYPEGLVAEATRPGG